MKGKYPCPKCGTNDWNPRLWVEGPPDDECTSCGYIFTAKDIPKKGRRAMRKEIQIPFSEDMRRRTFQNMKFCTTRSKKYGQEGDFFRLTLVEEDDDLPAIYFYYVLIAVERHILYDVAHLLYWAEGFHSPGDFIQKWNELHPRKSYDDNDERKYWTHWYRQATFDEEVIIEVVDVSGEEKND